MCRRRWMSEASDGCGLQFLCKCIFAIDFSINCTHRPTVHAAVCESLLSSHGHMLKNRLRLDLLNICTQRWRLKTVQHFSLRSERREQTCRGRTRKKRIEASIKLAADELHLKCIRLILFNFNRSLILSLFHFVFPWKSLASIRVRGIRTYSKFFQFFAGLSINVQMWATRDTVEATKKLI